MAEPGYNLPLWDPIPVASGPSAPEWSAPLHRPHALPFPPPHAPLPYNPHYAYMGNSQMMPLYPDTSTTPSHFQSHIHSPYPPSGGHLMSYPTPPTHPSDPSLPRHPPTFRHGHHTPPAEFSNHPSIDGSYMRAEYSQPPFYATNPFRYDHSLSQGMGPTPSQRPYGAMIGSSPTHHVRQNSVPSLHTGTADPSRPMPGMNQRLPLHERLPSMLTDAHAGRLDRNVSLRSPIRRSYDRYSVDLAQPSLSSHTEEVGAHSRARQRMRGARLFGQHAMLNPNLASVEQVQELKDTLPRRLPSELPEEASKTCDICAKDYSATTVTASEEAEVAVELPCGHYFGEFCIHHWFDTCKTQKNKVTCPMCRKRLVGLPRSSPRRARTDFQRFTHALLYQHPRPFIHP